MTREQLAHVLRTVARISGERIRTWINAMRTR